MRKLASFVLAAGLGLVALCSANAGTYEILLPQSIYAGTVLLAPGQYRVTVDGSNAIFQEVRSERSFHAAVRVEDAGVPYEITRIRTSKNAGVERMDAIEFEGTGTKIEFSSPSQP
jgi:hypothetical protein